MRAALLFTGLCLAWAAGVSAQETDCYELDARTVFCGKEEGWKGVFSSAAPGTFTFENQEYIFAITVQGAHGQTPSPELFDLLLEGSLASLDERADVPTGTHHPLFVDFIDVDGVEGRRMAVSSVFQGQEVHYMMDVLMSSNHAWTTQTGHLGPITLERLAKVHTRVMEDLSLEP